MGRASRQRVNRWCVTCTISLLKRLPSHRFSDPLTRKGGICIMATGNKRNGIALIGRILIYKQENKYVFLLLLSLVVTCFFRNSLVYVERFNNSINSAKFYGVSSLYFYFIFYISTLVTGILDSLLSRT